MDDREIVQLGDVVDLLTGFPFKSAEYSTSVDAIRLLRGDNIIQGALRWDSVKRWPNQLTKDVEKYFLDDGDVVLAMDRPWIEAGLKYACLAKEDCPSLLVQRVARLRGTPRLETRFLRYVIGSRSFTDHVLAVQTGTAVPHISGGQIKSFCFPLPPLVEQRKIAAIVGALDDKIDLNRRMNETLETVARAIFKDWFVDFGPTRAKMEGRAPYQSPDVWSLFPDRLDDDDKPVGWDFGTIANLAKISGGKQLDARLISSSGKSPVFGGAGPMGFTDGHNVDGFVITFGRVGAYCGQFFWHNGMAWINNNASLVSPHAKADSEWIFLCMSGLDLDPIKRGAAQPFVSNGDMASLEVIIPPEVLRSAFRHVVAPFFERLQVSKEETQSLAATRDLLLPKLMSGEIRIKDAEKMVETVL